MRNMRLAAFRLCCAALLCAGASSAPGQTPATQRALPAEARRIGPDRYRLGRVTVDLAAGTAVCDGKVNMRRGAVEYLAVAVGGKRHESVLLLDVRPLHLQLGLVLLGLEPKGGIEFQGDERSPEGSPVRLTAEWTLSGKTTRVPASHLAWDMERKQPMPAEAWTFSGSRIDSAGFLADVERNLIALFRDPNALINNRLPSGSDDTVYKVNERIVPALGTPVRLEVRAE